jgi:hypothetical protein
MLLDVAGLMVVALCSPGKLLTIIYYLSRHSFLSTKLDTGQTTLDAHARKIQCTELVSHQLTKQRPVCN